jgi:tetratricopeptide (TPR) repeat protein
MSKSKNNSEITDQWMIKSENEQVKGPYSTDAVSKMILEGIFSGQEEISGYPDGDWRPISKQSEFYEVLLESLENPVERDEKNAVKMDAETVIRVAPKLDLPAAKSAVPEIPLIQMSEEFKALTEQESIQAPDQAINKLQINLQKNIDAKLADDKKTSSLLLARDQQVTIELQQIKKLRSAELTKLLPFVLVFLLLVGFGGYYFFSDDSTAKVGWVLLTPQKNKPAISDEILKKLKSKSFSLIKTGNLEDLLLAQKNLVAAVEGSPADLESRGLLCMTYVVLWPYTKQSADDQKAFAFVTQSARSINPISSYSDACQASYLFAKGQFKDARGLVEKVLDQNNEDRFLLFPFLYLLKADLLEDQQSYVNADAYYVEAAKAFPGWGWAEFGIARMLYKENKFNESRTQFEKILQSNPNFKAAKYGVALNEVKQNNIDKALLLFAQGFAEKRKLPKNFHLEALQEYIKLLMQKNDQQKALAVATFGLEISPSHRALKEIVISLGGTETTSAASGASELILLGEQFARGGDHLAAQAQFKAAFDLDPKNAGVAIKVAKSLWALNQVRESLLWIDKSIKLDAKNVLAYSLKADYLSQKYNFSEASRTLAMAMKFSPNSYEILKAQAQIETRKNNTPQAVVYGEKAVKLYDADVELLTLLANAHVTLFLNSPSRTKEEQDAKDSAINLAQKYSGKAVDLEPGWPEAQITYAKYIYAAQGNVKSENYLKELIKNYPYTLDYRLGLAAFYEFQEKYKSAAEIYQQLVGADPKDKKANFGLARCYRNMNDLQLAQKYYLASAVLDPSDVEPLFATAQLQLDLAIVKNSNAEINLALSKFKAVKNINPNYPLISYSVAKALLELGQFPEAIEMIKEEKTKNPSLAEPYLLAAEVFDRKGQFKECAAEYSFAIKLRSNSADLYVKAATCYRKSDAIDIAQDMLDIAKQHESGFPNIYREQGFVFEKKGQLKQAKDAFSLYLELSPNAIDRTEIESKVNN